MMRANGGSSSRPALMTLVAAVLLLVSLGSTPDAVLAQTGAGADPRRVPPSVLWSIDVPGVDVAIGEDGDPVVVDSSSFSSADIRVIKIEGATGATVWDVLLDSGSPVDPKGIAIGPDANPIVVATAFSTGNSDFRLVKLDGATGAILWNVLFDGDPDELAAAVAIGPDGNPIVTGSGQNSDFSDIRTAKFDGTTGALLWSVRFSSGFDDYGNALAVTPEGDAVVAGLSDLESNSGPRVIMYDGTTGATIWNVFLPEAANGNESETFGVAVGSDGNPVITGDDLSGGTTFAAKINGADGTLLWTSLLGDNTGAGGSDDIAIDPSGDPIVTGSHTVRYDGASGETMWSLTEQGGALLEGRGIAVGPDDKVVVTGEATVKYGDPTHSILWVARAADMDSQEISGLVAVGPDDNPVVTGNPGSVDDFRTIKYDAATGSVLWSVDFDSGGIDQATGVAVGPDADPVVVGSFFAAEVADFRIVKFDGAAGAIRWSVIFDSGLTDVDPAVAVGSDGDPVVAGTSGADLSVIKLDGDAGTILWSVTFDSGSPDSSPSLAVGPDGNPVVAGTSGLDFRVIKIDGATGSVLWTATFDGGTAFGDHAFGVAIGPDGNPVVAGGAEFFSGLRLHTIKYDGDSGQVIWSSADNHAVEIPGGVAVGLDGNPWVTWSTGASMLRALRYDGLTGAELSTIDFDTGDEEDYSALAVGPDGNPVAVVVAYPASEGSSFWIIKYLTEVETASGSNVVVELNGGLQHVNGVSVTYLQVIEGGATSFSTSSSGPPLPAGFALGDPPVYYDFSTTAVVTPPVTVCIKYDPARFGELNDLRLLHSENDAWVDVTTSNDAINHVVCGQVESFSLFAVAEAVPAPPATFDFSGFFPPVQNLPAVNPVKAGRAIPVKFSLSGFQGLDVVAAEYPKSQVIACGSADLVEGVEETQTPGGSGLGYDPGSDRYTYVWKTEKQWSNTCRQLVVKLTDGTLHRANFEFAK